MCTVIEISFRQYIYLRCHVSNRSWPVIRPFMSPLNSDQRKHNKYCNSADNTSSNDPRPRLACGTFESKRAWRAGTTSSTARNGARPRPGFRAATRAATAARARAIPISQPSFATIEASTATRTGARRIARARQGRAIAGAN